MASHGRRSGCACGLNASGHRRGGLAYVRHDDRSSLGSRGCSRGSRAPLLGQRMARSRARIAPRVYHVDHPVPLALEFGTPFWWRRLTARSCRGSQAARETIAICTLADSSCGNAPPRIDPSTFSAPDIRKRSGTTEGPICVRSISPILTGLGTVAFHVSLVDRIDLSAWLVLVRSPNLLAQIATPSLLREATLLRQRALSIGGSLSRLYMNFTCHHTASWMWRSQMQVPGAGIRSCPQSPASGLGRNFRAGHQNDVAIEYRLRDAEEARHDF